MFGRFSLRYFLVLATAIVGLLLWPAPGCAATNLSRDANGVQYHSTKDVTIGRAEWREWYQDGKPKSEFILDNGGGNASQVNQASWQGLNAAFQQGMQLGATIARASVGLPPVLPAALPVAQPPPSSSQSDESPTPNR